MTRSPVALLLVVLGRGALAQATAPAAEKPKAEKTTHYAPRTLEPVRPGFALSSNTDGSVTIKVDVPFTWQIVPTEDRVRAWSVGPTLSWTEAGKGGAVTLATTAPSTRSGKRSITGGVLVAFTRQADITELEKDYLAGRGPKVAAVHKCLAECKAGAAGAETFCVLVQDLKDQGTVSSNASDEEVAVNLDPGLLCPDGLERFAGAMAPTEKNFTSERTNRFRFPVAELSVWGGLGSSLFEYYQQLTPASGSTPATYAAKSNWRPSASAAAQLTWVPLPGSRQPAVSFTLELPVLVKYGYEAGKESGTACTVQGTVSDATLSKCDEAKPIGAPKSGAMLTSELYLGIVDRRHGWWRVALGGSYTRDFVARTDTWAIKLPVYIDAAVLGGDDNGSEGEKGGAKSGGGGEDKAPVVVSYAGIVRVTPTLLYAPGVGQGHAWTLLISAELLGQRNLFSRADRLVR